MGGCQVNDLSIIHIQKVDIFLGLSFLKIFCNRGWLCWLKPWCDDRLLKLCRLYRASVDLEMLSAWVPKFDSNFQISSSTSCRHLYLNQVTKLGLFSFLPLLTLQRSKHVFYWDLHHHPTSPKSHSQIQANWYEIMTKKAQLNDGQSVTSSWLHVTTSSTRMN